jgi:hypothetical protein
MYLAGWAERVPDESWNHRLMGIIDPFQPFLKDLGPFLMSPPRRCISVPVKCGSPVWTTSQLSSASRDMAWVAARSRE